MLFPEKIQISLLFFSFCYSRMSRLSSSESSSDTETDSTSDRQENRRDSILSTGSNSQSDSVRNEEIDFGKGN